MDIKKIIREESDSLNWAKDVPSAEVNTYYIDYRMSLGIDATSYEEAETIWHNLNLSLPTSDDVIGVKYSEYLDDNGFDNLEDE